MFLWSEVLTFLILNRRLCTVVYQSWKWVMDKVGSDQVGQGARVEGHSLRSGDQYFDLLQTPLCWNSTAL